MADQMNFEAEQGQMNVDGVVTPPATTVNPQAAGDLASQVNQFISQEGGAGLTYDEIVDRVGALSDSYLAKRAEAELSRPEGADMAELNALAGGYNRGSGEVAKVAMGNELASGEKDQLLYSFDYRRYVQDRQEAAEYYSRRWIEILDEITGRGLGGWDRFKAAASLTSGFYQEAFTPGSFVVKMSNMVRDQFPDAPIGDATTDPNKYIQQMREYAYNLPRDKREAWVQSLLSSADQNSMGGFNTYTKQHLLRLIFDGIGDPNRNITNANMDVAFDAAGLGLLFVPFGKMYQYVKGKFVKPPVEGEVLPPAGAGAAAESGTEPIRRGVTIEGEWRVLDDQPAIAPTSAAQVAAATPSGTRRLVATLSSSNPEAAAGGLGTTPPDIAASLLVPPMAPGGKPFLPSQFIDGMDQIASAERGQSRLVQLLGNRLIDSPYTFVDDGWEITATIGQAGGLPFRDAAQAGAFAQTLPFPTTVVTNGRGTFLQRVERHYWDLSDPQVAENVIAAGGWREAVATIGNPFGKGILLTPSAQAVSTEAAKRTEQTVTRLVNMLAPVRELSPGERIPLLQAIARIEGTGTANATYADFLAMGLSPRQARGGEAYMQVADEAWRIKDNVARGVAVSEGWLSGSVNGVSTFVRPTANTTGRAVDGVTGAVVNIDPTIHAVYELVDDVAGLSRVVYPLGGAGAHVRDLPMQGIMAQVPNYMPRLYQWARIVEEEVQPGRWVAQYGADTEAAAHSTIDLMRQITNNNLRQRPAMEIAGAESATTVSEFREMAAQGLLNTGTRRPNLLTDITGATRMASPEDRLNSLVMSAASADGVGLWAKAENQYLRNTWGEQFDLGLAEPVRRALFRPNPEMSRLGISDDAQYAQALARFNHARSVTGSSPTLLEHRILAPLRNYVADALFNTGTAAGRAAGREVAGVTDKVSSTMKTVSVAAYLQGNPFRQAFIQIANIPTFMAQPGAFTHAASGRLFQELTVLQAAVSSVVKTGNLGRAVTSMAQLNEDAALFAATRFGWTVQEARALLRDFRASGYFDLARGHGADLDTLSQTGMVGVRHLGQTIQALRKVMGSLGYDPAINLETRSAWLVARNAFRAERGRLPVSSEDFTVVNGMASQMQMHMNRGGVLPIQRGMVGAVFQFYSAQLKSLSRMLMLESGFSMATKAKMAAWTFAAYGTAGYGFIHALDAIEQRTGVEIPEPIKYICLQGIMGSLINAGFNAVAGDSKGRVDVSGTISPVAQVREVPGRMVQQAEDGLTLMRSLLMMSPTALDSISSSPAGAGFMGGLAKSAEFAYNVVGKIDMPADEKAMQITKDFLTRLPITNQFGQALMQYNLGVKYDARGRALVEVSKGEAIGSAGGFKSMGEAQLRAAQTDYFGPYISKPEAVDDNLKAMAKDTFAWMGPMLRRMAAKDGVTPTEVWSTLRDHAVTYKAGLTQGQQEIYFGALGKLVSDMDELRSEQFAQILVDDFQDDAKGRLLFGEDSRDYIRRHPFPGSDKVIEQLDILLDIKALLGGKERE